ncbi:MAG: alpha/beta hydrolase fold domain-containing protein, partial [Deltaproteobacteria bacterium]|nr:alpha/beta hydrolase fold domain-containing protein [Deltaproteobacteria bacterium]
GDSAGGGLALATVVALRDDGVPLPAAVVALSPWTDLAATGASVTANAARDVVLQEEDLISMARLYLGNEDPRSPLASPLYADLHGLPPLLVLGSGSEILLDDATRIAERARGAGVAVTLEVWEEMPHLWPMFAKVLPEGQRAIDKIGNFVVGHASS